jgi:hypothetical protein
MMLLIDVVFFFVWFKLTMGMLTMTVLGRHLGFYENKLVDLWGA